MTAATGSDPFALLTVLPGVHDAVTAARSSVDALLRHRVMRRGSAAVTTEVSLRAARASAALEGHDVGLEALRARLNRALPAATPGAGSPAGTAGSGASGSAADANEGAGGQPGDEPAGGLAGTAGALDIDVTLGAIRLYAELGTLRGAWERAPRQALARMHVLVARGLIADIDLGRPREREHPTASPASSADLLPADASPAPVSHTGRPAASGSSGQVASGGSPTAVPAGGTGVAAIVDPADPLGLGPAPSPAETAARLSGLTELLLARTSAPAILVAAIVEGELLTIRPFGTFDGIIARAAGRLVLISRGLDPKAVTATDVGHVESGRITTSATAISDTTTADMTARNAATRNTATGNVPTDGYADAARAYAGAGAEGVRRWIIYYAHALELGARESLAICEAVVRAN
ncbi:hypothetical protein [Frankia sp. CiP1_Cm_nod2]|uniref:hypothetical protein n=1 Tax=Frankia sp. CiP1_Cm_nod2 TaxID=2897161 RepID=UPI002025447E